MNNRHVRQAAHALRRRERRAVRAHSHPSKLAIVRQVNPLAAEMIDHGIVLDDDDLVLSQWVRRYDEEHSIDLGDTLVLTAVDHGHFIVTDVIQPELPEKVEAWRFVGASGQPAFGIGQDNAAGYRTGFYKDYYERVHLRGRVTKVGVFLFHPAGPDNIPPAFTETIEPATQSPSTLFILPVGYRPDEPQHFMVAAGSPPDTGQVDVLTNGHVNWADGPTGEPDFITLTGISFRAG